VTILTPIRSFPRSMLNLVPTIPEEYAKLGSYAMPECPKGLCRSFAPGAMRSEYCIMMAVVHFGLRLIP